MHVHRQGLSATYALVAPCALYLRHARAGGKTRECATTILTCDGACTCVFTCSLATLSKWALACVHMHGGVCVCVHVCVCVLVRAFPWVLACASACTNVWSHTCVRACAHVPVSLCESVCFCGCGRVGLCAQAPLTTHRSRVFVSVAAAPATNQLRAANCQDATSYLRASSERSAAKLLASRCQSATCHKLLASYSLAACQLRANSRPTTD